ncbi:MAG TPA: YHYH protein [Mycobacteriales bacterium]|nr:YHYH protein [Mycobacteriales bacterium]
MSTSAPQAARARRQQRTALTLWCATLGVAAACGQSAPTPRASGASAPQPANVVTAADTARAQGLTLDPNKRYGNRYANGILPVGDGKYSTAGAKKGYIYACAGYAQNLGNDRGGADTRGSWFSSDGKTYDVKKKLHVQGHVLWNADFSMRVSGGVRTIVTNDLPKHPTGVFPIASSDPAYRYDRNPNTIKGQTLTYRLPSSPRYGAPSCMGGEVGVMLTGVALFNAFDAGARDAGAWEVQDSCSGHPQVEGEYHYHTLSSCIHTVSVHTVIGYALDGFPITGPQVSKGNVLTTRDLDVCHGITSTVTVNGKSVTTYHYVMTQDFPYSASCFRGAATAPPGMRGGPPA